MDGDEGRKRFASESEIAGIHRMQPVPMKRQQQLPFPQAPALDSDSGFDKPDPQQAGFQLVCFDKATQPQQFQQRQDEYRSVDPRLTASVIAHGLDLIPDTASRDKRFQMDSAHFVHQVPAKSSAIEENKSRSSDFGGRSLKSREQQSQSQSGVDDCSVEPAKLTPVTVTARVKPRARGPPPSSAGSSVTVTNSNQQPPATISTATSESATDCQQQQLYEYDHRPSGQDALTDASSSRPQRATLCLQRASSDPSSKKNNLFVALMDQNVPCLIARNDSRYFVIGSLHAKGDGPPQTDSCAEDHTTAREGHLPAAEMTSLFRPPESTRVQTDLDRHGDMDPVSSGGCAVGQLKFHSSHTQTHDGTACGRIIKKVPNHGCFAPDSTVSDRSAPAMAGMASLDSQKNLTGEHEMPDITECRTASVDQFEKRVLAVKSDKNSEDGLIFLGGHFLKLQESAHPFSNSSSVGKPKSCMERGRMSAVPWTSTYMRADTEDGFNSASSSCIIVSDEEEDIVCTGFKLKPHTSSGSSSCNRNCSLKSNKASVIQSPTYTKEYCPVQHVIQHQSRSGNNQLKDVGLPEQSSHQHGDGCGCAGRDGVRQQGVEGKMNCSESVLDLVSRQTKSALTQDPTHSAFTQDHLQSLTGEPGVTGEPSQPICRVVSTMSLRMDKANSQTSEAKSLRKLSAEAFYCCGCAEGTCGFQSLASAELLMHLVETHHDEAIFLCVHCGDKLPTCDALVQHIDKHLDIAFLSLYCSVTSCDFHSSSPTVVSEHIANIHPTSSGHTCWRCSKTFPSVQDFRTHITKNTVRIALCPHCSAKHTDRQNILYHIITSHENKGRVVAFQEMLLCQERALTGWWKDVDNSEPGTAGSIEANSRGPFHLSSGRSSLPKPVMPDQAAKHITQSAKDRKECSGCTSVFAPASSVTCQKMTEVNNSADAVEIVLSSEESDETLSAVSDSEGKRLLKLRQQWSNENLSAGPVIEIDRAESPGDLTLFPWERESLSSCTHEAPASTKSGLVGSSYTQCENSSQGSNAEINLDSTNIERCADNQASHCVRSGCSSSDLQHMVHQSRKRSFSGETAMTSAIKFHETRSEQNRLKRKKYNRRSSLQDFYTTYKKGCNMVYKCLCCEYSSMCPVKSQKGYAKIYNHVHREHSPYTFQCPAADCVYQNIFKNDMVKHIERQHPSNMSEMLIDQIFQAPKRGQVKTAIPSSTETSETSAADNVWPTSTNESSFGVPPTKAQRIGKPAQKPRTSSKKTVVPRDLYTVVSQGLHGRVLKCLCCGYSITQSHRKSTPLMTMHVWQHMEQRFQCNYCGYRAYPSFKVKKHIQHYHPGMDIDITDLESDAEWLPSTKRKETG